MSSVNRANKRESWSVTSATIAAALVVLGQSSASVFGQDYCDHHCSHSEAKSQSRWPWLFSQWHFSNGTPRYNGFGHRDKQECCPAASPVSAPYFGVYNTCWRQLTIPQRCPTFPTATETIVTPPSLKPTAVDQQSGVQYVPPSAQIQLNVEKPEQSPAALITIRTQESNEGFVPPSLPELR